VNLILAFVLYDNPVVHTLAILFGFNIILDNLINAIKSLNIAEFQQIKSFKILIIDSFLLCLTAAVLYIYPFSIVTLTIAQIIIRTITINLFLKLGSSELVSLRGIVKYPVRYSAVKSLVLANWTFVVIGSISLLFWRSAQIIISKLLTLTDVAVYGVAYKIFQIAIIIPLIISSTVFPSLVKKYNPNDLQDLRQYYQQVFLFYFAYGLLAFTFIYSFSDFLIPLVFGDNYTNAIFYTKLMFLTILVFPTAILQANLLVAMKLEKYDMIYNLVSLGLYLIITFVGLSFIKDLMVINLSIFFSFFMFHVLQDFLLVRKGVTTIRHVLVFYGISVACVLGYLLLADLTNLYLAFFGTWLIIGTGIIIFVPKVNKMVMGFFSRKAKLEV
jgi:O-antigen/teichoic acid export membrane protein